MANKRIALSVPADIDDILNRLSRELEKPKTAIITEMLRDALPLLANLLNAVTEAKKGQSQALTDSVANFLRDAAITVNQQQIEFEDLKQKYDKSK